MAGRWRARPCLVGYAEAPEITPMDPNDELADLMDALTMGEWDNAIDIADDLQSYLDNGGTPPEMQALTWRNLMDGIRNVLQETQ